MRSDRGHIIPLLLAVLAVTIVVAASILAAFPDPPGPRPRLAPAKPVLSPPTARLTETALRLTRQPASRSTSATQEPPRPRWIWSEGTADGQAVWLRRRIETPTTVRRATLRFSGDNHAAVSVNGVAAGRGDDWQRPQELDVTEATRTGSLEIVVEATNDGGPAGFIALLELVGPDDARRWIGTGPTWEIAEDPQFASMATTVDLGPLGIGPWGELPAMAGTVLDRSLAVLEGFEVEPVYVVPSRQGSWVSLAVDDQGRLIASDQANGLYRIRPARAGRPPTETTVDAIELDVGGAQGLLCLESDLYAVVNVGGPEGPGLYRLRDRDDDDRYDELELLRAIPGGTGEHGAHAIVPGPDGLLYVTAGNHTPLPAPEQSTVPRVWDEDHLLPRLWDARGHATGVMAPGGWICRTDPDGRAWELFAIGFRNTYDLAFNADGELFTFDADMEWDMGAPWYRPTRVCQVTSGAEFGWRSGTGKWPPHYPDSLPAILDVGPGSPTGVLTGVGSAFPPLYRDALFILDWTFGTIYAVHLEPDGASYRASQETFLTGRPLPLADAVINPVDGAMYFVVGGRGMASAIYRVRWRGGDIAVRAPTPTAGPVPESARARRRALETLHRPDVSADSLDRIWFALDDDDRFVRYAARIALEHQAPERWAQRAAAEARPRVALAALLALARIDDGVWRAPMTRALAAIDWETLDREGRLELLRCWALRFVRGGAPDDALARSLRAMLEPSYPTGDEAIDRELCDMLVYLDSDVVVARTVPLMELPDAGVDIEIDDELLSRSDAYGQVILRMASARPQRQQVHYALSLRNATRGWTGPLRRRYFRWFDTARSNQGGLSFAGFLDNIRADALAKVAEPERERYATLGQYERPDPDPATRPRGPGRSWTASDVITLAEGGGLVFRSHDRGSQLFRGAMCAQCHRLAGRGLAGGPDLSGVASRFSLPDLVTTIIEPSRAISDQYAQTELVLDDDSVLIGRVVHQDDRLIRLMTSLLEPDAIVEVDRDRVVDTRPSSVSAMMPFLLDPMAPGEVLDLLAYLLSGGDPRAAVYTPPDAGSWRELFDGATLRGWSGDPTLWRVDEGTIIGRTSEEAKLPRNVFLVLDEPLPADFHLEAEVRLVGDNNSGIQYRSRVDETGRVTGYQCDVHPNPDYDGMLYEEGGRGIMAEQGQRLRWSARGRRHLLGTPTSPLSFDRGAWHRYEVIARGNHLEHRIDGTTTCVVIDEQGAAPSGDRVALQLHAGAAYEVRFRSIRVRDLGTQ